MAYQLPNVCLKGFHSTPEFCYGLANPWILLPSWFKISPLISILYFFFISSNTPTLFKWHAIKAEFSSDVRRSYIFLQHCINAESTTAKRPASSVMVWRVFATTPEGRQSKLKNHKKCDLMPTHKSHLRMSHSHLFPCAS